MANVNIKSVEYGLSAYSHENGLHPSITVALTTKCKRPVTAFKRFSAWINSNLSENLAVGSVYVLDRAIRSIKKDGLFNSGSSSFHSLCDYVSVNIYAPDDFNTNTFTLFLTLSVFCGSLSDNINVSVLSSAFSIDNCVRKLQFNRSAIISAFLYAVHNNDKSNTFSEVLYMAYKLMGGTRSTGVFQGNSYDKIKMTVLSTDPDDKNLFGFGTPIQIPIRTADFLRCLGVADVTSAFFAKYPLDIELFYSIKKDGSAYVSGFTVNNGGANK